MSVAISGPRGDGSAWPGIGGVIDVPDVEGVHMCAGGMAVPVVDDYVENTGLPAAEVRDVVVESDGAVDTSARDALVPSPTKRTRTRNRS